MAAEIASLFVTIGADLGPLTSGLNSTKGMLGGIGQGFTDFGKDFSLKVTAPIVAGLGAAIWAASNLQDEQVQLNAVLKSTGGIAGMTAAEVMNLGQKYSDTTRFSKDTVLATEDMLLTFRHVGGVVFPQATQAILDMAQAMGEDTKSAAIRLGKALEDPVAGIGALKRVGVVFNQTQKDMIQNFVNTNQLARAQGIILGELQKEFGGSAEAAGGTFGGALDILGHKFQDVLAIIGTPIISALTPILQAAAKFMTELGNSIAAIDPHIIQLVAGFAGLVALLGPASLLIGALLTPMGLVITAVAGVGVAFATNFGGITTAVGNVLRDIKPDLDKIGGIVHNFMDTLFPKAPSGQKFDFDVMHGGAYGKGVEAGPALPDFGARLQKAIADASPAIQAALSDIFSKISVDLAPLGEKLNSALSAIGPSISKTLTKIFEDAVNGAVRDAVLNNPTLMGILGFGDGKKTPGLPTKDGQVGPWSEKTVGVGAGFGSGKVPGPTVDFSTGMQQGATDAANAVPQAAMLLSPALKSVVTDASKGATAAGPALTDALTFPIKSASASISGSKPMSAAVSGDMSSVHANLMGPGVASANTAGAALSKALSKTFGSVGDPLVSSVRSALLTIAAMLNALPGGVGTGLASGVIAAAGARASGGPVTGGLAYLVGENGPELFVPGSSGSIVPNAALAGGGGGGRGGASITIGSLVLQGVQDPQSLFDALDKEAGKRGLRLGGTV